MDAAEPPSSGAVARATQMRSIDAALDDEDIELIARGIDEQRGFAAQLAPKKGFANAVEPLTSVRVPDTRS